MTARQRLRTAILEAQQLRARNDGIHNMHGACIGIETWEVCRKQGIPIDWENVEELLCQMRICDKTGKYPSYIRRSSHEH